MTHIYDSPATLTKAYANHLQQLSAQVLENQETFSWALSGGNTPKLLFSILAKEYRESIPWNRIHIYWGDERCVAPDDEESNYFQAYKSLLRHIPIPQENIHRIKGENDPREEAIRYAEKLSKKLPSDKGWPVFDLIWLGLGTDGHTASIFPGQEHLFHSEKNCAVSTHPQTLQKRVSLTGGPINQAKRVHFLVTGAAKAPIVRDILQGLKNYPASLVNNQNELIWFLDQEAGQFLSGI